LLPSTGWEVCKPVGALVEGKLTYRLPTPFTLPFKDRPTIDTFTRLTVGPDERARSG
jgi:hypothetical protein